MEPDHFPQEAVDALGRYVYRLIDPRNGETFYVGRGRGQRVFDHVRAAIEDSEEDAVDPKIQRIHEIRGLGMKVTHVIHRHGMTEGATKEVEAALIDAYPGLENRVAGSGSGDRGPRNARQIVLEYGAEEFVLEDRLILISIGQLWRERGVYEAVRGVWMMNMDRAKTYDLVLARVGALVLGAYRPEKWLWGTGENFPLDGGKYPKRIGFRGREAEDEVRKRYVGKRVPAMYRKRGAQLAFRYLDPR